MNWRDFEFFASLGDEPIAIAHRGGIAPGEPASLETLQRVTAAGVRYLEVDLRTTAGGQLVVWHGKGVERLRPGSPVDLRRLAPESVLCFEDVVDGLPAETRFFVDLKDRQAVEALADVVARTRSVPRVCVGSFSHRRTMPAAAAIARKTGQWPCTAMTPRQVFGLLAHAALSPAAWDAASVSAQLPARLATSRVVDTAHAGGALVFAWTVNDDASMRRLLDQDVDGLMTDELDRLKLVLDEHRAARPDSYARRNAAA